MTSQQKHNVSHKKAVVDEVNYWSTGVKVQIPSLYITPVKVYSFSILLKGLLHPKMKCWSLIT